METDMLTIINWKAAVWAGIIAGAVFMVMEMLLVGTVGGDSPWAPPRMIAAIALGPDVLPPPAPFDVGILLTAMMVHFPLAIIYSFVLGWAVSRWRFGLATAMIAGLVFGVALYLVNFYGFTALFPWFAMARNWITVVSHAAFGLVLGWVYHAMVLQAIGAKPRSATG